MTVKRSLLQEDAGIVNAMRYAATPSALNSATLLAALAAIGSTPTTLLLQPGTWSLTTSIAVPATCTLWRSPGTILALGAGTTLTLASPIYSDDPTEQYFSGTGTATFAAPVDIPVRPQWWGAVGDRLEVTIQFPIST